jgi:hypothetical protein
MGVLVVKCYVTGREFSTGVHTDARTFGRMKNEVMQSRCPHCMSEHSWRPLDAKLVDTFPSKDWIENQEG